MEESESVIGRMNEISAEGDDGGSTENCDENDALLLEQEDTVDVNNLNCAINNDDTITANNMSEREDISPVTANNLVNNLGSMTSSSTPKRFLQVEGFDGRRNDIVYCKPVACNAPNSDSEADAPTSGVEDSRPKLLLFFGGDIQDFPEMMEQHRDHRNYVAFNLEATAVMLQKQFPDYHIAVVRPSRIQMLTFSCYDNFVHCNHTGAPEHVITHHSLHHLQLLIQNLSKRVSSEESVIDAPKNDSEEGLATEKVHGNDEDAIVSSTTVDESSTAALLRNHKPNVTIRLDRAAISLVGFSKGCVVLNQLLYEFHYLKTLTPDDLSMDEFLNCIKDMYWLDGGHNGGKNTWITSRSLLETLTRLGVRIHVHLTPYQLLDDRRPWIRKEEKLFSELLKKFSAPITRHIHFESEPANLLHHLRIIGDFASDESKAIEAAPAHENIMEHT